MQPKMSEARTVTSVQFNDGLKYASYSCSRCRRLKKKCSKAIPTCYSCQKAEEICVYHGRARRRTKKELEEARKRGEFVPIPRPKKKPNWGSCDLASNVIPPARIGSFSTLRQTNALPFPFYGFGKDMIDNASAAALDSFMNILSALGTQASTHSTNSNEHSHG
ncbi:HEL104Cp [Eremothecium sinecaudum]|uniref:HEL104Cp n=1 Tax=Eremothecium sinecaudum TaxID=45286 RepID=A0A0X8HSS0_9SACH|nr:HEL104Cp [Eremothecium sinecaudum]AMD21176.1 HEL104Cp [Eremothecium sinecaudum]